MLRAALVAVALLLLFAATAAAEVVRLRVDWAPADGRAAMHPPYLFASGDEVYAGYQSVCGANCGAGSGYRWVEENLDAGGQPRTVSFVDETATQYETFRLELSHPFANFGPNIVGTATIRHADGRSYQVPFDVAPALGFERTLLGTSDGFPPPSEDEQPDTCTIATLRDLKPDLLIRASFANFKQRWRRGESLKFDDVYACGKGKIKGRLERIVDGERELIGKARRTLDYPGPGRVSAKVKLNDAGERLYNAGGSFRARLTVTVIDGHGDRFSLSRTRTLRR